jgi:hypothetical protein
LSLHCPCSFAFLVGDFTGLLQLLFIAKKT